eukprot:3196621-Rhodomonas_salina.2
MRPFRKRGFEKASAQLRVAFQVSDQEGAADIEAIGTFRTVIWGIWYACIEPMGAWDRLTLEC